MEPLEKTRLGTVTLTPATAVVAGTVGQWTLVYRVGSYGIDEGGTLKLAQRFAGDWQEPQFEHPDRPGYTTVKTDGAGKLRVRYDLKGHQRPWQHCLVIDVYDGFLAPGDQVTIVMGDQSQGSPGIRAQTFQETAHEFRFLVDPFGAGVFHRLPSSPVFPVLAGEPVRLVSILPTQMVVGERLEVFVKGEDRWGNPTPPPAALSITSEGDAGVRIEGRQVLATSPGRLVLDVSSAGLVCRSNPVTVLGDRPVWSRFWGDLHGQTDATVGTGTEEEYFRFARDWARLDFASHQGNDFQMTDSDWRRLNEVVGRFNQAGRFVVFPGYEWSANTPAGGDRNVFYLEEDQPIFRSSHWQIPEVAENEQTPAHPADQLFARLHQTGKALVAAHVGGRYADIHRYFDEELGPLVEVASCWGVFEWLLEDALEAGYQVGIICNSDGHKGRPGAEGPGAGAFGIAGGLTCVLAEELTREAIFQALQQRRCYGTTGPRMDLSFAVNGRPMGSAIAVSEPINLLAEVTGTGPLEALLLYQGREIIDRLQPAAFANAGASPRIRVSWRGARIRGRGRRVTWDGTIRLQGTTIHQATPFAFDTPANGIVEQQDRFLRFTSQTTGDTDGIDLILAPPDRGWLVFASPVGTCQVDLAKLDYPGRVFDFGGLDMQVTIQRYPERPDATHLALARELLPPAGVTTPYFVKAIQEDGHMAWASPVYVTRPITLLG